MIFFELLENVFFLERKVIFFCRLVISSGVIFLFLLEMISRFFVEYLLFKIELII